MVYLNICNRTLKRLAAGWDNEKLEQLLGTIVLI